PTPTLDSSSLPSRQVAPPQQPAGDEPSLVRAVSVRLLPFLPQRVRFGGWAGKLGGMEDVK
ncbi:unnamed protein product, partial [Urochloa humidicola]